MQADDAIALLELCRSSGINTAVETCGSVDPKIIKRAVGVTDLFLWDIKDTDNDRHIKYTGVSNERIISNLLLADSLGAKTVVRCITVNGVNTNEAHYNAIADIVLGLKHCEGVVLIPYHSFGGAKTVALGCENEPHDGWIPTKEQLDAARSTLRLRGVKLLC